MKACQYPSGCNRPARYFQSWSNENGRHSGLVCDVHDTELGRANLMQLAGMSAEECVLFERYLALTVDLTEYPDWPDWLEQYTQIHGKPIDTIEVKGLDLSSRTFNALRRNDITTIAKLASMNDYELSQIRCLGVKSINEIHEQLEKLGLWTRPTTPNPIVRIDSPGREYRKSPGRKRYGEWRECIDCEKPIFVRQHRITKDPNSGKRCASCNRKAYPPPVKKVGQKNILR